MCDVKLKFRRCCDCGALFEKGRPSTYTEFWCVLERDHKIIHDIDIDTHGCCSGFDKEK